jgi:hypothetical protein
VQTTEIIRIPPPPAIEETFLFATSTVDEPLVLSLVQKPCVYFRLGKNYNSIFGGRPPTDFRELVREQSSSPDVEVSRAARA